MKKFLMLLFCLLLLPVMAKDETIGILATVNGNPITLADVMELTYTKEAQLPLLYKGEVLQKELWKARKEALETVIERKLFYEEFKKNEYKLPRDLVESNMDILLKAFNVTSRHELENILREEGKTIGEFKSKIYESIAVDALIYARCYKNIFVTPQDVSNYYDSHKSEFTSPASVRLSVITIKKTGVHKQNIEELSKVLELALKSGDLEAFKNSVSLYSDGPRLEKGGDIGWISVLELRKEFTDIIKHYKKDTVYGPINTNEAIYFLRITDYTDTKAKTYEECKSTIKEKLTEEAKKKSYDNYVKDMKAKAYIVYCI
jgi:peptidyl-prolyl cis-trans isomerase SurA